MLGRSAAGVVRLPPRRGAEQPGYRHGDHGAGRVQPDAEERHDGGGRDGRDRSGRIDAGARRRGHERDEGARHRRDLRDLRPRGRNTRCRDRGEPLRANQPPRARRDRDVRGTGLRPVTGGQRGQAMAPRRIRPSREPVHKPDVQEACARRRMGGGTSKIGTVLARGDRNPDGGDRRRRPRRIRRRDLLRHPRAPEHARQADDGEGGRFHRSGPGDA